MPEIGAALRRGLRGLVRGERTAFAFLQTVFSQAFITLVNLATGVFLARMLGPEGRGAYAAITFWPLVLATMALAGLPYAQVYRTKGHPERAGAVLGATLVLGLGLSALGVLVGLALLPWLMGRNYDPQTVLAAQVMVMAATPVMLIAMVLKNSFSALGQYRLANTANQADVLLYLLLLLVAAAALPMTPELAAGCMFAGAVLVLGLLLVWQWRLGRPHWRGAGREARPLVSFALRAAPNAVLANLALSLDRMVLVTMVSQADFGLYVVAFGLSRLVMVVQQAVASVGFPAMAGRDEASTKAMHDRLFRVILYAMFGMVAGGWVLGGLALRLLYGPEFAAAAGIFHILLIGAAISCLCQVPMQLFLCLGRPGFTSTVQAVSFAATALALVVLVPWLGAIGAAYAVLAGGLVRLTGLLLGMRRTLGLPLPALLPSAADIALLRRGLQGA
ncbi:lipopolysaccharide biosynthesis protein [Teichococcus aerofrigidensis]